MSKQKKSSKKPISPKQAAACCGPIDDLLTPALFKAMGDSTRAKLIACLTKCSRPCSVSEVAECCSVDFSVVSRHLAVLEKAGILEAKREGRTVYYSVQYQNLAGSLRALADAIEECCPSDTAACSGGNCG